METNLKINYIYLKLCYVHILQLTNFRDLICIRFP